MEISESINIIFPIVCGRGLVFMYEFMHVCKNVYRPYISVYIYIYVGVHACMCVRLANRVSKNRNFFRKIKNGFFYLNWIFKIEIRPWFILEVFNVLLGYYNYYSNYVKNLTEPVCNLARLWCLIVYFNVTSD